MPKRRWYRPSSAGDDPEDRVEGHVLGGAIAVDTPLGEDELLAFLDNAAARAWLPLGMRRGEVTVRDGIVALTEQGRARADVPQRRFGRRRYDPRP